MKTAIRFCCIAAVGIGTGSVRAWSAPEPAPEQRRLVTVQGEGKLPAVPDIATLGVEVSLEGPKLDEVSAQVRERAAKILNALKDQGIADKDLQTQLYHIQPRYEYDKNRNPRPTGYRVTHRLQAKVRDLKKVGRALSAVVDAGATTVDGPNFDFDNPQALEQKALAKAMDNARANARILAEAAGATLGEPVTITQNGATSWPGPRPFFAAHRMMAATAAAEEPVAVGEQSVTVNLTASFALK